MNKLRSLFNEEPKLKDELETCLGSVENEFEKLNEKKSKLQKLKDQMFADMDERMKINFGGTYLEVDRDLVNKHCENWRLRFSLFSGKYDHLFARDKNDKIFFDFDANWIKSHLGLLQDLDRWDGEAEGKPVLSRVSELDFDSTEALSEYFKESSPSILNTTSLVLGGLIPRVESTLMSFIADSRSLGRDRLDFNMLYRGSRDGFQAQSFCDKCYGAKETIVLVRDTEDNIFGGYLDVPWSCEWAMSNKSFLFNLKRGALTRPMKHKTGLNGCAVACDIHSSFLFSFGYPPNCGLHITTDANLNTNSNSTLIEGFVEQLGFLSITTAKNFRVIEVELYQVAVVKKSAPAFAFTAPVPAPVKPTVVPPVAAPEPVKAAPVVPVSKKHADVLIGKTLAYCEELLRGEDGLLKAATEFRDELHFVAKYLGLKIPSGALDLTDDVSGAVAEADASPLDTVLSEIEAAVKFMSPVKTESSSPAKKRKIEHAKIVYVNAGGAVFAVSGATLSKAPPDSILANMLNEDEVQETDTDGNIVQRVNPKLFTAIINHLRLKALLPTSEVPPIVVYEEDRAALDRLLALYGMGDAYVKCI